MTILKGDLFQYFYIHKHLPTVPAVCPHCTNNVGAFGAGFAAAVARTYPIVQQKYYELFQKKDLNLTRRECYGGTTQFVTVNEKITFANMFGQNGLISPSNPMPVRYEWLETCMGQVAEKAKELKAEIITIPFGSGLAGGDRNKIYEMMNTIWKDIPVTVYTID